MNACSLAGWPGSISNEGPPKRDQVPGEGLGPWQEKLSNDLWLGWAGEKGHLSINELGQRAQRNSMGAVRVMGGEGDREIKLMLHRWRGPPVVVPLRIHRKAE